MVDGASSDGSAAALSGPGESVATVGFSPTTDVWPPGLPVWADEVQVAIELPMGPQGPDGAVPRFDVESVSTGSPANVSVRQNEMDGAWYFTFTVPQGLAGQDGTPGPPLNFKPLPPSFDENAELPGGLPLNPLVGDGYVVGGSLWVYGTSGWVEIPDYKGPEGPPSSAHVGVQPPVSPSPGQIWFDPTAMGFVPTGLRVDRGAQFGSTGGYIWGNSTGELVFNVGVLPSSDAARAEQARLTANELRVKALVVSGRDALRVSGSTLVLGHATATTVSAGPLEVPAPVSASGAVNRQYVENAFVSKAGDTMSGQLTVPAAPTADGHAASKKYVDGKVLYGPAASVPASLPPGTVYAGW